MSSASSLFIPCFASVTLFITVNFEINTLLKVQVWQGANMKAVRVNEYGGPEALSYEDIEKPVPSSKEALIKINASCLYERDTY